MGSGVPTPFWGGGGNVILPHTTPHATPVLDQPIDGVDECAVPEGHSHLASFYNRSIATLSDT